MDANAGQLIVRPDKCMWLLPIKPFAYLCGLLKLRLLCEMLSLHTVKSTYQPAQPNPVGSRISG